MATNEKDCSQELNRKLDAIEAKLKKTASDTQKTAAKIKEIFTLLREQGLITTPDNKTSRFF